MGFTKMHGLGNDFILIADLGGEVELDEAAVRWFCDRHFGVGADGLILLRPPTVPDADLSMLYRNADGTTAEMCGNGARCFAKYAAERDIIARESRLIRVQTLGGVREVTLQRDALGDVESATVDMGVPRLHPEEIPSTLPGEQVFECPIETAAGTFEVTAVNMGNPHAVVWVDDVDEAPVETVGPLIETHEVFPERTNVEFAQVVEGPEGPERILLRVWERGVGETMACGTGACATLVASVLACLTGRESVVEVPGGELVVRWAEDEHVYLTGPAEEVFSGVVRVPEG
ncbi:MAG: diaminopimelate epimerase [Coriobacteriia bacterium]|nr:diaminopimelate epimerase [Coriobacteriia bacterium]